MSRPPKFQPDATAAAGGRAGPGPASRPTGATASARSTGLTRGPGLDRAGLERLARLEGHQVSVALDDGSRIDDCQLVSGVRPGVETLWLFDNGADRFVALQHVMDVWEAAPPAAGASAA